jgi:nitrogen fixation NifU-like protein
MTTSELDRLYQDVILDHDRHPRGWGPPPGADRRAHGDNPFCGDQVTVYARLDGDRLAAVGFEAQSCAIARASASMMTEATRGRTCAELEALFARFQRLLRGEPDPDGDAAAALGPLVALGGVAAFPVRIACATLPWTTLLTALR